MWGGLKSPPRSIASRCPCSGATSYACSYPTDRQARRAVFRPRLPKVALFGSGRVFIASTPNFGPSLTKLVGTIRFTKKMTHNDNGAGPGRIYGETAVFTFCRKAENGPKIRFFPKKSPKFAKRLIFIWEKGTFFFWQLCPVNRFTCLHVYIYTNMDGFETGSISYCHLLGSLCCILRCLKKSLKRRWFTAFDINRCFLSVLVWIGWNFCH